MRESERASEEREREQASVRHCGLVVSACAWDGSGCEFDFLAVSDIYLMFIEPTITWVSSGFFGYIWLDTKIVLKKKREKERKR